MQSSKRPMMLNEYHETDDISPSSVPRTLPAGAMDA